MWDSLYVTIFFSSTVQDFEMKREAASKADYKHVSNV